MSAINLSSIVPQPLSTAPTSTPVSTNRKEGFWKEYNSERAPEIQQLGAALKSGNLAEAEQAYNNLVALGNKDLHQANPFVRANRALDFNAIGGALQNGDLAGARKAFADLENTFKKTPSASPTAAPASVGSSNAGGAEASGVNVIA